jgi:ubiquinol-cytochrome c reductase cytochrome c1 subunit
MGITKAALGAMLAVAALTGTAAMAAGPAAEPAVGHFEVERQKWSFGGLRGQFDQAQLQRGYQIYKDVCASCHSMKLLAFRNLSDKGGPSFPVEGVKELAASFQIEDGPNDAGKMFKRKGVPSDRFPSPFTNEQQARAANNGAYPPDLSVMAKARGLESEAPFYLAPMHWIFDILTGYQEGGADYIYGLLTGYMDMPKGMKNPDGTPMKMADLMNFNTAFPGHQIAMPQPIQDGMVKYSDGTPAKLDQYARDVTAFLMWAAEPKLEERKFIGICSLIFLLLTAALMYISKKRIWAKIPH